MLNLNACFRLIHHIIVIAITIFFLSLKKIIFFVFYTNKNEKQKPVGKILNKKKKK
jgi:hypothetical protein